MRGLSVVPTGTDPGSELRPGPRRRLGLLGGGFRSRGLFKALGRRPGAPRDLEFLIRLRGLLRLLVKPEGQLRFILSGAEGQLAVFLCCLLLSLLPLLGLLAFFGLLPRFGRSEERRVGK